MPIPPPVVPESPQGLSGTLGLHVCTKLGPGYLLAQFPGDGRGGIGGYSFVFFGNSFNYEVRLHPRFVDMVMIVDALPKGTPFGSEIFEKFVAKPGNLTAGSGHFLDIDSENILPVWLWRKLLK